MKVNLEAYGIQNRNGTVLLRHLSYNQAEVRDKVREELNCPKPQRGDPPCQLKVTMVKRGWKFVKVRIAT